MAQIKAKVKTIRYQSSITKTYFVRAINFAASSFRYSQMVFLLIMITNVLAATCDQLSVHVLFARIVFTLACVRIVTSQDRMTRINLR
jgi:hypothetical protein